LGMNRGKINSGFTLLEIMTVLVIIAIMSVFIIQAYSYLMMRAQGVSCTNNLKNLYAASSSYVMDNQSWPQVSTADLTGTGYAQGWIDALAPYKIGKINWVCPTVQRLLNNPDLTQPENIRVDYFATPFDSNVTSPSRYPTQPWFIENANVHGDGNLMIFANGQVKSLNETVADLASQPSQAQ
jgi:prepilin-type N-terminal cleavage/methylation domain-containing protein